MRYQKCFIKIRLSKRFKKQLCKLKLWHKWGRWNIKSVKLRKKSFEEIQEFATWEDSYFIMDIFGLSSSKAETREKRRLTFLFGPS